MKAYYALFGSPKKLTGGHIQVNASPDYFVRTRRVFADSLEEALDKAAPAAGEVLLNTVDAEGKASQ